MLHHKFSEQAPLTLDRNVRPCAASPGLPGCHTLVRNLPGGRGHARARAGWCLGPFSWQALPALCMSQAQPCHMGVRICEAM